MKKIRIIVAATLRGLLILAPGVAYLWWLWGKVPALVAILAAAGLETIWAIVFSFVMLAIRVWREKTDNGASEGPQID